MYFRYKISAKKDKLISIVDSFDVEKAVEQLMTNDQKSSLKLTNYTAQGIGPNHIIFYTAGAGLNPNNLNYIGLPLNNKIHDLSWVKCDRLMSDRTDLQSRSIVVRGSLYIYKFSLKDATYSLLGFSNHKLAFLVVDKPCSTLSKLSRLVKDRSFVNRLTLMPDSNNSSLVSWWRRSSAGGRL